MVANTKLDKQHHETNCVSGHCNIDRQWMEGDFDNTDFINNIYNNISRVNFAQARVIYPSCEYIYNLYSIT